MDFFYKEKQHYECFCRKRYELAIASILQKQIDAGLSLDIVDISMETSIACAKPVGIVAKLRVSFDHIDS
jgi:hypothetical protein